MDSSAVPGAPVPQPGATWRGRLANRSVSTRFASKPGAWSNAGTAARRRVATHRAVSLPRAIPADPYDDYTRPQPSRCGARGCAPVVVRVGTFRKAGDLG